MNFDVRAYCERIAKACPDRFRLHEFEDDEDCCGWTLVDNNKYNTVSEGESLATLWAFIGPLAVEIGVHRVTLECPLTGEKYADLLEATFAAVCDRLEADA